MPKILKAKLALRAVSLLIAIGLIGYGASYFVNRHKSLHQPLPNPNRVISSATNNPSETPVNTDQSTYSVAADKPKLIGLPSLNSKGFIQQVAVDNNTHAMATPNNVYFAGWYIKSAKPGDGGLSIINGHVSGRYQPGIFKNLSKLKPGATFYVLFGDGSRRNFAVLTNHSYAVNQITKYLYNKDPNIDNQLNLITCGGQYDSATHQYNQRVLVTAKRVS